jgi:hypothetical protein
MNYNVDLKNIKQKINTKPSGLLTSTYSKNSLIEWTIKNDPNKINLDQFKFYLIKIDYNYIKTIKTNKEFNNFLLKYKNNNLIDWLKVENDGFSGFHINIKNVYFDFISTYIWNKNSILNIKEINIDNIIKKSHLNTYLISGDSGTNKDILRNILNKNNFVEVKKNKDMKYVDFIYREKYYYKTDNKSIDHVKSKLINLLDPEYKKISLKHNLFEHLYKIISVRKHLPKLFNINDIKSIKEPLIIKPSSRFASGGKDIYIITNIKEFEEVKKKLIKYENILVQEYLINPLLFNGYKFHLRIYLMISTYTKPQVFKIGKIITAKKKYIPNNFYDKNIHDTHIDSTPRDIFFPEEYPGDSKNIFKQIKYLCNIIGNLLKNVKTYPENKFGYNIFGLDFMVQNDTVYLLEMNSTPGMDGIINNSNIYNKFIEDYFNWLYKYAISPIFK